MKFYSNKIFKKAPQEMKKEAQLEVLRRTWTNILVEETYYVV